MANSKARYTPLRLKLLPQWLGQSGLWRLEGADSAGAPVEPEEIGLSEALTERLDDWSDAFDAIYDEADPSRSRFESRQAHGEFLAEGEAIAALIRRELGAEVLFVPPQGLDREDS